MESPKSEIAFLFWGRKGGGSDLLELLTRAAVLMDYKVASFARPVSSNDKNNGKQFSVLNVYRWLKARRYLIDQLKNKDIKILVIVMASPWDLFLGRQLEKKGIQVTRIIHDSFRHKGDLFPPKIWIRLLLKDCSKIVTLSEYVARDLLSRFSVPNNIITKAILPPYIPDNFNRRDIQKSANIVLIGRGKKYQGQKLIEETWKNLEIADLKLIISGQGFKPNSKNPDIEYRNSWMSRVDFLTLIQSAKAVVLPYSEATQSGIIPLCAILGTPVIVTPSGGLPEQVEFWQNGIVSSSFSPKSFADAIAICIEQEWKFDPNRDFKLGEKLVVSCLPEKCL
jgi:glycosyltransferase involved in cell wall biosynthesis